MTHEEFNKVMDRCTERMKKLCAHKSGEYANDGDKLENFHDTAHLNHEDPLSSLWGMWVKHVVSVAKFMRDLRTGKRYTLAMWQEKLGDMRTYAVLAEAILLEHPELTAERIPERAKLPSTIPNIMRELISAAEPPVLDYTPRQEYPTCRK